MPATRRSLAVAGSLLACLPLGRACAQTPAAEPGAPPLELPVLVRQAIGANPSARAAQQKLVEAQAKLAEAAAQRRMQLTFTGSVSGSHGQVADPVSVQTFGTVEGTVALPLPNVRRLAAASAQAEAGVRAAQAGLLRARLDLAFRASDAYYGLLRARDARDIAADNLAQAERQVADTRKRVEAGDVPAADVLKAEVPLAQARVALARAQNAVREAEQTLNSLVARGLTGSVDLAPAPAAVTLSVTREQAVSQALGRSPDVLEAQANLDTAVAALASAHRSLDPAWTVQATHTRTTDPTAYASLTTLMLSVDLPLSEGGVARQQVKQAEAVVEQNRSALAVAKQQAELAAEQAFLDVQTAQAAVTGTQETVRIAQESLDKARQAYAAGLTTTRDVLDAQLALTQARSDAAGAVYDLAVARAKLDQAMGKEPLP